MSILIVGSVALDSVETPAGKIEGGLGGSAVYASLSASYFYSDNRIVAVVGTDFPKEHLELLEKHSVNVDGIQIKQGRTFRWSGSYGKDFGEATTLRTQLNVFATFHPEIPENYKDSEYVFLANIDPDLQLEVLEQVKKPKLVIGDTMNFWISGKRNELLKTLKKVDLLIINDAEARQLAETNNTIEAAKIILTLGPKILIIKKGGDGAMLITKDSYFFAPAYPLTTIQDPTGAGDTFAGGVVGYIAKNDNIEDAILRKAVVYGGVMASYNVEKFSVGRLQELKQEEIEKRFEDFKKMTTF